jgi:ABC-type phosphate transport system permease subunit
MASVTAIPLRFPLDVAADEPSNGALVASAVILIVLALVVVLLVQAIRRHRSGRPPQQ